MEECLPEKYVHIVKDTFEEARTQVTTSVAVRVGLHQWFSLSSYLFDFILDVT